MSGDRAFRRRSIRRTQLLHFVIARLERAVLVGEVDHHAPSILERRLADVRAHRRLVVLRKVVLPSGDMNSRPLNAEISFSVSAPPAFVAAAAIALMVEYPTTEPRRG